MSLAQYYLLEFADRTFQLIWPCKSNKIRFIEDCCSSQPVYATLVNHLPPLPPHTHTHTHNHCLIIQHNVTHFPYPCTIQFGEGSKAWEYFYMGHINVYLERQRGRGCPNWNNDLEAFLVGLIQVLKSWTIVKLLLIVQAKWCIHKMLLKVTPSFCVPIGKNLCHFIKAFILHSCILHWIKLDSGKLRYGNKTCFPQCTWFMVSFS